jgi:capsid protein
MPTIAHNLPARTSQRVHARRILGPDGRPWLVNAKYEAAQTTNDNRRRWTGADSLAADYVGSSEVRQTLRNRARYETRNNSYLKGIIATLANDTVGVGPQLGLNTGDNDIDAAVEMEFWRWSRATRLAEKLRTIRAARAEAGEAFGIIVQNRGLAHEVKIDLQVREAEEIADPALSGVLSSDWYDGIRYDQWGNPAFYRVLRAHPGAQGVIAALQLQYDDIPARYVLHYYRPGQRRGVPDITPSLPIFMELRRFCEATLAAAETAADFAGVLHTNSSLEEDNVTGSVGTTTSASTTPQPMDLMELSKRMATVLPEGWDLTQLKAENPNTTYEMFVNAKLREVARCLNMPFTIAALDSSQSNLSAAYLDHQTYAKAIGIDRDDMERLLDRLLDEWLTEAIRVPGLLPELPKVINHSWRWPCIGQHADPMKVAAGANMELQNNSTTLAEICGKRGADWEDVLRQRAKERKLMLELDLVEAPLSPDQQGQAAKDEEAPPPGRGAPGRPRNR